MTDHAPELTFCVQNGGVRLDHCLAALLPHMGLRGRRRLCDEGRVHVNGRPAGPGYRVLQGQLVQVFSDVLQQPGDQVSVVSATCDLAAVDKPAGVPSATLAGGSHGIESVLGELFPRCPQSYPVLLNRLDTGTSGIVLTALSAAGEAAWQAAGADGSICKRYLAVTVGAFPHGKELILDRALDMNSRAVTRLLTCPGPPERHTRVRGLGVFRNAEGQILSLVGCSIIRGARHQIRVHLAGAGFPLWQDVRYANTAVQCQGHAAKKNCASGEGAYRHTAAALLPESLPPDMPFVPHKALSRERGHDGAFFLHHALCRAGNFVACCLPDWLAVLPPALRQAALDWLEEQRA